MTNTYEPTQLTIWDMQSIGEWHAVTFPDATLDTQLLKLEEEMKEYNANPCVEEAADIYIVACALAYRYQSAVGMAVLNSNQGKDLAFFKALAAKMDKNMKRSWAQTTPGYYKHEEIITPEGENLDAK